MRSKMLHRVSLATVVLCLAGGCSHYKPRATADALKRTAETFHRQLRWGDLRGSAQLLATERRMEFLKGVLDRKDDDNLKVTDYDLEEALADAGKASVLSKITWHRLPSVVMESGAMTLQLEERDGAWAIVAIEGGPVPLPVLPSLPAVPTPAPAPPP